MSFKEDPVDTGPPAGNGLTSLGGGQAAAPPPLPPTTSASVPPPPPVGPSTVSADEEVAPLGEEIQPVPAVTPAAAAAPVPVQEGPVETTSVSVHVEDDPGPVDAEVLDDAPAAAAAGEPPATDDDARPRHPSGGTPTFVKLLWLVLAAAIFGVAGYWIAPREADSAQVEQQSVQTAQAQAELRTARAELAQVKTAMTALQDELADGRKQAEDAAEAEATAKGKVTAAEQFITQLSKQLAEAKTANGPMMEKLAAAEKQAADSRAQAGKAKAVGEKLKEQLAAVTEKHDALTAERKKLLAVKARLTEDLAAQSRASDDMKRLLDALDMGEMPEATHPAGPAEMPITVRELTRAMGPPTLTVQANDRLTMRWGTAHQATSVAGVAATLDGKPATRGLLGQVATVPPRRASAPGAWRMARGHRPTYAELVSLFGQPDRLAGKGSRFRAWWSIGAWARKASATVVNGIVTSFDGKPAEASRLCALVPHRPGAYRRGAESNAVRAAAASAKACYQYAVDTLMPDQLRREAVLKARDGLTLTKWTLAPFDSVGTWIARTDVPVTGAMTLRAAVDCEWTAGDGARTVERRYVVLAMVHTESGDVQTADYASIQDRD